MGMLLNSKIKSTLKRTEVRYYVAVLDTNKKICNKRILSTVIRPRMLDKFNLESQFGLRVSIEIRIFEDRKRHENEINAFSYLIDVAFLAAVLALTKVFARYEETLLSEIVR